MIDSGATAQHGAHGAIVEVVVDGVVTIFAVERIATAGACHGRATRSREARNRIVTGTAMDNVRVGVAGQSIVAGAAAQEGCDEGAYAMIQQWLAK